MLSIDTVSTLSAADSTDAVPQQKKHVLQFSVLASWQRNHYELTHGVQIRKRFLQPALGDLQCTSAYDRLSLCEPTGRVYTWSWQWLAASVIAREQGSHGRRVADQVWFLLPCWGPSAVAPMSSRVGHWGRRYSNQAVKAWEQKIAWLWLHGRVVDVHIVDDTDGLDHAWNVLEHWQLWVEQHTQILDTTGGFDNDATHSDSLAIWRKGTRAVMWNQTIAIQLVHSQVTIIFVVSVSLSVCLWRVFLSCLWSDFDQTRTYVICLGLVVCPRL